MPSLNHDLRFAIAAGFDASLWAGVDLYSRGGDTITGPSGWGLHEDPLVFLNGLGSSKGLGVAIGSSLDNLWTGSPGTGTAYIDADDRVVLEHTGGAFSVTASAANAIWGIDTAGQSSVSVAGTNRLTAVGDWQRGVITNPNITVDPDGAGAPFSILDSDAHVVQSVPTALRWHEEEDADGLAALTNLEAVDHSFTSEPSIRWGINDVGHVYTSWEDGMAAAPTWISGSFRQRLGFTGREEAVVDGDLVLLTAANPLPGFIVPTRPLMDLSWGYGERSSSRRLRGGLAASSEISEWWTYRLKAFLGGPASLVDETAHWLRHVVPYIRPGRLVSIYQEWGDPRRARNALQRVVGDDPYSTLYTEQEDGRRGRLRCVRSVEDSGAFKIDHQNRVRLRFEIELLLEERKD
tara:strand:+ start:1487 stop:2707 length:1221 start_codon:yes stop_codon:yes gene_type:complete